MEDYSIGFHFLEKVQDLPTRGGVDVEHFTIDGSLFLAFANHHADNKKIQGKIHNLQDGQLDWKIVFVPDPADKGSVWPGVLFHR